MFAAPLSFCSSHAAVLVAIGRVPARLVAVEVVEEGVVAGLARGVRPPAGVGVRVVVAQRHVGRDAAVRELVERGLRLAGAEPHRSILTKNSMKLLPKC